METELHIDYQNVYHTSPDMCLSLAPSTGEIIECNQTLCDVLGYTKEEVLNASLFDLYHENEREKANDNLQAIKENRIPTNKEFIVQKKNGELIEVTLNLSFVKDREGKIIYTNAIWRDIGVLKDTQRKLSIEKEKLERKNNDFVSAIEYAKLIQTGMLPEEYEINQYLPNSFIFFRPKDIVSGDFYWSHKIDDEVLFSVFDCTGHGIPGAFLSMLGGSILNKIVAEQQCFLPETILNNMRASVITYLKQGKNGSTSDGMDGTLCVLNNKEKTLRFSAANRSILLIRQQPSVPQDIVGNTLSTLPSLSSETHHLYELRGDRQPIGYFGGLGKLFCEKNLKVEEGDMLFIYSDGFQDQFGGEKGKKYLSKRFKKLLLRISQLPVEEQNDLLDQELKSWINGTYEQTDDICIWGVRV